MKLWRFYLTHSSRDMLRNKQRTLFALLCVAVGVGAIVSLRMLGIMIEDALTMNIAAMNRGDMYVRPTGRLHDETDDGYRVLSTATVDGVYEWADENDIAVTGSIIQASVLMAGVEDGDVGRPVNARPYFVEGAVYPFYDEIVMLEPAGMTLAQVLAENRSVALAENLADRLGVAVGDQVQLSRADELFTVGGVFPTEAESFFENGPENILFGYFFIDMQHTTLLGIDPRPSVLYLKLPDNADLGETEQAFEREFRNLRVRTTDDLLAQNQEFADVVGDFVLIMGLAALVVGGVGIINTMLVVVGRRTVEIAVLKTLGLKGGQVTLLFLVEALLLGLIGSLLGVILGWGLSFITQIVGENFLQQSLRWRLSLDPVLIGIGMGVVITAVFGFLPTLAAARVRPATVLRPADALLPRAGILRWLLAILVLTMVIGLLAAQIVGHILGGMALAVAGMVMLGLLIVLFWVIIWLVGKLPTFGWVDLKLALREMSNKRTRTATSLLALTAGVFALSVIVMMSATVVEIFNFSLTEQLGGNVFVASILPGGQQHVVDALDEVAGVNYTRYGAFESELLTINEQPVDDVFADAGLDADQISAITDMFSLTMARDIRGETPSGRMVAGRALTPDDVDRAVIVIPNSEAVRAWGVKPGDVLELRLSALLGRTVMTFEVVGIAPEMQSALELDMFLGVIVPIESVAQQLTPQFSVTMVDAGPDVINEAMLAASSVPGSMTYEVAALSGAIERLLQQMSSIPLLIAGLALFAGAMIIANTVALATLERRRQIGVMKALGIKGRRVLILLLLENGIVGLIGGGVGIGVSVFLIWLLTYFQGGLEVFNRSITTGQVVIILSLSVGIAVLATILTAWGASHEKPMNVLRYE